MSIYTVKVEESTPATDQKPSAGPVYRCIYAKNALMDLPPGLDSLWDFFSSSVQRNPKNRMLGRRQIIDSKAGPYVWFTYEEAYDAALRIGSAIRSRGLNPGDRCGIYGSNCPEWIISMEACNSHCITYVPLYDTLGMIGFRAYSSARMQPALHKSAATPQSVAPSKAQEVYTTKLLHGLLEVTLDWSEKRSPTQNHQS